MAEDAKKCNVIRYDVINISEGVPRFKLAKSFLKKRLCVKK